MILLDLLVQSGVEIYYSGDFDPEGMGMAQRLLERYPEQVRMWRFGLADYHTSLSDQPISESRLKKLDSIWAKELLDVVELMWEVRQAGYQEHLIEELWGDLRKME